MSSILLITIAITAVISFIGFQNPNIFEKYKFNVADIQQRKEYIRLLSAGFLHADMMHLFFNMLTLFFFAPVVISYFDVVGFLIIYLGSILLGNIFSLYIYRKQGWYSAIGASGGVSGILFAAVSLDPVNISVNFIPGFLFGALYFGYSVYSMLNPRQHDMVGHAAHLGGAFFGLVYSVVIAPQLAISNGIYLLIMALPLLYLAYEIIIRKRIG